MSKIALINGIHYGYEVHGRGAPVLLLHGGLMTLDMFRPWMEKLSRSREVIAVDLQGHGRTALGERPFTMESVGDDMAALVKQLGHDKVDVVGYSLGGGVAFRMAAQNPERVRRLVLVSTPFSDAGWFPEMKPQQTAVSASMAPMMKQSPMYAAYAAVAPNVDEFPRLLDALGDVMRTRYDWSADVAKLTMPTMLVYGDSDMTTLDHEIAFYKLLGGGQRDAGWQREHMAKNRLAIVPDATHYDIFDSLRVTEWITPFLDK